MENKLHWFDYVIMSILLGISFGIGVYHSLTGGRQRTTSEFFLANRQLMVIPTIMSMVMSYMSGIAIIGMTAEVYQYGSMPFVWYFPGDLLGNTFIALVIVPWIYPLKLVSVFDYLQYRFNSKAVRYLGSTIGILHAILYNGASIFAPSIALESVTGLSVMISLPVLAFVGTGYTALGGIKAVIWTDLFQGLVLFAGFLAVLIKGLMLTGGFGEVMHEAEANGRLILNEFNPDPRVRHSALSLICHTCTTSIFLRGFCQASVQRYSATKTQMAARKTIIGNGFLTQSLFMLSAFIGLTVLAYFAKERCDPMSSGLINNPNKILTVFVETAFDQHIGFNGFFIATLYSGSLSSLSSNLSGCSANIWEDILKPLLGHRLSEYRVTQLNKLLVVVCGILSLGVAYVYNTLPGSMMQLVGTFFGICAGPMIGLFLLGGLFRFTNYIGAICGVVVSFMVVGWINVGSTTVPQYTQPLPSVPVDGCLHFNQSYSPLHGFNISTHSTGDASVPATTSVGCIYQLCFQYYGTLGVLVTLLTGTLVSAITNTTSKQVRRTNSQTLNKYFIQWRNTFRDNTEEEEEEDEEESPKIFEEHDMKEMDCNGDTSNHLLKPNECT